MSFFNIITYFLRKIKFATIFQAKNAHMNKISQKISSKWRNIDKILLVLYAKRKSGPTFNSLASHMKCPSGRCGKPDRGSVCTSSTFKCWAGHMVSGNARCGRDLLEVSKKSHIGVTGGNSAYSTKVGPTIRETTSTLCSWPIGLK